MGFTEEFNCYKSLGAKMGHTIKAMIKKISTHFVKHGVDLTMEQYFILNILDDNEGIILQDIADMIERDKSAVLRHINALEKKHYVARATCDEDKRKKILIITKPGMETLQMAQALSAEVENELTHQIDNKDLIIFEKVLFEIFKKAY